MVILSTPLAGGDGLAVERGSTAAPKLKGEGPADPDLRQLPCDREVGAEMRASMRVHGAGQARRMAPRAARKPLEALFVRV